MINIFYFISIIKYLFQIVNSNLDDIEKSVDGLNGKIIKKIYTRVTTDSYGYFDISGLRTDISNGYTVANAYAKDAAVGSDGNTAFPVFSINSNEQITSYGYMYSFTGGDVTTVKNAINMTVVAVLTKC